MRCRIQPESCTTEAKAMSSSFEGSGPGSALPATKRFCDGPGLAPGISGSHNVAGASESSSLALCGPTRISYNGAIAMRQLPEHWASSSCVYCTCTSFSAWAKVSGETSGPTAGAVPKAGGAPGGCCC